VRERETVSNNELTSREFIFKLENPQVYTGKEINAVRKTPEEHLINVCLVFPDTYEIGMSHYGLKILYHLLNRMPHVNAERCFLPGKASIETFKQHNFPLFSLENKRPLNAFDLIGFSLLTEMTYTNVLQVLELAQIPLRSDQRKETFPLIAAGGISAVNPEPLRDFFDIFAVGDGEVLFPEIINILSEIKKKNLSKESGLSLFDQVEGLYVPALSPLQKKGRFYTPQVKAKKKRKRITKNIKTAAAIFDHKIIVPITNVVFNRLTVEIARGCQQNCRFCQAKAYYSPYRAQSLDNSIANIREGLRETGFETFSLSSLSTGDYPWLEQLLQLIPNVITSGTSFSLSSLRPSSLSEHLLSTIALFRRTGITIVPEAGTERLRRVINKNVTDEEIFKAVELALQCNWQKIKLYFMIGLPTETMEDIDAIIQLIRKIKETAAAARKKIKIHASFSSFVPKPHTPLQWARREDLQTLYHKIHYLKSHLKTIKRLDLDIHNPQKGVVETILARGDYRVGELLQKAFEAGEIFCAWDADFHFHSWHQLIEGSPFEAFLTEIGTDEPLPWDFFEVNYKKEYLLQEYEKASSAIATPSCLEMECHDCKGCFYGFQREKKKTQTGTGDTFTVEVKETIEYNKVRIFYEKKDDFIFFSHLSMIKYVERLIRKTGAIFKCTEGFHPRMKVTALPPLPVFATGLDEVVELFVDKRLSEDEILTRLKQVSRDLTFKKVIIANQSCPLPRDIHFLGFEISIPDLFQAKEKINAIKNLLGDTDRASWSGNNLVLSIDYAHQGQERFAKIYKCLDPDKKHTVHLTRTKVMFKAPLHKPV
jgi:radical SAM family uncharacterized protein